VNNKSPSSLIAYSIRGFIAILLLISPFIFWQGALAFLVFENDIYQWLPKGFKEAKDYQWFKENFGVDEMVVVSWPGCTDPSLAGPENVAASVEAADDLTEFAQRARDLRNDRAELYFDRVTTGSEILDQLRRTPGIEEKEAVRRATGVFISPDGKTTCCICYPSLLASQKRSDTVDRLLKLATEVTGLPAEDIHMGGPTIDGAAIDQESKTSLKQFLWMSVAFVMFLAWFRTRNLVLSAIILIYSLYCAAIAMAILRWTGGTMNLTMIMLPTLTFILGVSGAIHMTNYFVKAYCQTPQGADAQAVRYGGYPVLMSSLTTAVGMGSLATSQIGPIKWFGIYSAVGVMISLPILLVLLPYTLGWLVRFFPSIVGRTTKVDDDSLHSPMATAAAKFTMRHHGKITVGLLAGMVFLAFGTSWLQATVNIQNRFHHSTKIIRDYAWLEQNLGPLVPMEVVLRIPYDLSSSAEPQFDHWDRTRLVSILEQRIRESKFIQASYSAASFQPPSTNRTFEQQARKTAWNKAKGSLIKSRLLVANIDEATAEDLNDPELAPYLDKNSHEELWRISVRIKAMDKSDYSEVLGQIGVVVDDFLKLANERYAASSESKIAAVLTGGVPMMYKAQYQVLSDLMNSFLSAFVLITLLMIVLLRNFVAGLVSMLPNIFPPLVVFGWMGWRGMPIEIGSVMTASISLGIAVDDTIHFLAWHRRGLKNGLDRNDAITYAYQHCAKSMIDTTMICGLGTAPFIFSVFMPTVRFSVLMAVLLGVGLLGDLILLPAMLKGPLGYFFGRKIKQTEPLELATDIPPPNFAEPKQSGKKLVESGRS
jgi:uncharacterized protein